MLDYNIEDSKCSPLYIFKCVYVYKFVEGVDQLSYTI